MDETRIRSHIPSSWVGQSRCPVCSAQKMRIWQQPGVPDQLQCLLCETAFEVEQEGARLHLTCWPAALAACREEVGDRWLTVPELRLLLAPHLRARTPSRPADETAPSEACQPSPETGNLELTLRIKKLRELGNGPTQIRVILAREGTPSAQIETALGEAERIRRQELEPQVQKLLRAFGIGGVLVLVSLIVGAILIQRAFTGQGTGTGQTATLASSVLGVLQIDTPVVNMNAAPPAASSGDPGVCPRSSAEAAALFGGNVETWSPGSNGWMMINSTQTSTIYVPSGMTAAYLQVGEQLGLAEIHGPATMENVSYVAISCP